MLQSTRYKCAFRFATFPRGSCSVSNLSEAKDESAKVSVGSLYPEEHCAESKQSTANILFMVSTVGSSSILDVPCGLRLLPLMPSCQ